MDPIMDPTSYKQAEDFSEIGEVLSQRGAQTKYCSPEELQEMLHENKSFEWVFPTNENENVQITIHLHKEE